MTKSGMKFYRRCLDNTSQESFDFRFIQIVAKQLDDVGKYSEFIVAALERD